MRFLLSFSQRFIGLLMFLLAGVGPGLAAELRIPAATAYLDPDVEGARVRASGVSRWNDPSLRVLWFGEFKTTGRVDCALSLRLPTNTVSKLRLAVGGQTHVAEVTGAGDTAVMAAFGAFQITEPGYHSFTLTSLNAAGQPSGDLEALVLDGPACADAHFNLKPRRNAASVHLVYPVAKEKPVAAFYCEMTGVDDPLWTYYMACGWHRGYFGMQVNSPTERRIIFSVWDSGNEAVDRNKVAAEDRVTLVAKSEGVVSGDFGNEGTGGHSHWVYPWKTGERQRFLVTAQPTDATHTIYSGYYFHPEKKEWMLISSWKAPKEGGYMRGLYSFSENFGGANGHLRRKALFGNQWIRTADGEWIELTTTTFSHDPTGKADRLDRFMGLENGQFFLSHGGFGPGFTAYGQKFERPPTGQPPFDVPASFLPQKRASAFPVRIQVNAGANRGEFKPIWRFFGADEPNYATMPHGSKLLAELGALSPGHIYFRAHNLLTSGDGQPALKWGSTGVYREENGASVYDWSILDGIFDSYLGRGVRPYVEIGFMPKDLSVKPEPYQHHWTPQAKYDEIYTGWAYPPKDYLKWAELVYQWVRHSVEKYGAAEVERWYWEVWNEANIGYWRGTPEEFLKLHDYAIDAVRRALPTARVGGPDTAGSGGRFTRQFLEHCLRGTNYATGKVGTPVDFVSFHAKGAPISTNGHVRMGIAQQLRTIQDGFAIVASYPELKGKPIVIGESDPEGCAACQGPALAYRNGTMYSSYTAASFARKLDLAERAGVNLEGALTWAFEFENQPYFAGFRSLASNGIDKPVLNVFRMFAHMRGRRLAVDSDSAVALDAILSKGVREQPDVSALASLDDRKLCVLVWHYHDDDVPGAPAALQVAISNLPSNVSAAQVQHFRIDDTHSNAYAAWQRMGSPAQPTREQYAALEAAGQLAEATAVSPVRVEEGRATVLLDLPRQAVSLLRLTW